jgi:hypothetical protein
MPTCAIMQPTYLPWIGYFDLIDAVDVFVLLDTVQLERQSWQTRNRVKGPDGSELMLSIPVRRTPHATTMILEAQLDDHSGWRRKHLATIESCYRRAAHFKEVRALLEEILNRPISLLIDVTQPIIRQFAARIGTPAKIIAASQLGPLDGARDTLLVSICRAVGADRYLSPKGASEYIEVGGEAGAFAGSGIELAYHNYDHPVYLQLGRDFLPYMGIPDLIANVGFDRALQVVRSGRRQPLSSREIRTQRVQGV